MIELALTPLVAALGPPAGGALGPYVKEGAKLISRMLIGLCFGYAICGINLWAVLVAASIVVGAAPGHGHPVGYLIDNRKAGQDQYYDLEWWQPECLRHHPYVSLSLRGLLHLNPCFLLSLPLGMWLALRTPLIKYMDVWRWWEVYKWSFAYLLTLGLLYD